MSSASTGHWPELQGKVFIVTGGGAGIGRGVVAALAANGARVAIAGRDLATAQRSADDAAHEFGALTFAVNADVAVPADCEALVRTTLDRFGQIDGLVNNAAWFSLIPLLDADPEAFTRMFATNIQGPLFCAQALARWAIAAQKPAAIVNVSSIAGARPAPGCGLYSASKAALDSLTKTLALEWGPQRVRVNGVAPGHVDTEGVRADFASGRMDRDRMLAAIPARRIADVADIAEVVLFLLSERSRHVMGATLTIDGGEAM